MTDVVADPAHPPRPRGRRGLRRRAGARTGRSGRPSWRVVLAPGRDPAGRAPGSAPRAEEPDPLPALLRARPRPDQALAAVAAPRRQVPGVRRPGGRSPAHPAHPRGRGRPGRHRDRPGRQPLPAPRRGDRARPRLRPRPGRPRVRGCVHAVPAAAATTTRSTAPTSRSRRSTCACETLDGVRNHSWRRPAAVHARGRGGRVGRPHRVRLPRLRGRGAGPASSTPADLPAEVRDVVGTPALGADRGVHPRGARRRSTAPARSG